MIFGYERDCFNTSNIADLVNANFISSCRDKIVKNHYVFNKNWQNSVDSFYEKKLINICQDRNYLVFDKTMVQLLLPRLKNIFNNNDIAASGHFLYPKTGYMGWHTNYLESCWRIYITYATENKKSFFRYFDPLTEQIITDYDDKGLTIRKFYVPEKPPYFWHCVGSMCNRFSFGFRLYA
tara:strand:- start:851 stop:1390 length:540 start_codon:yes stop_codon:yes gene_type:complete